MSEKRRALGRGLGALIPGTPAGGGARPVDVFFHDHASRDLGELDRRWDGGPEHRDAGQRSRQGDAETLGPEQVEWAARGDSRDSELAPVDGARFAHVPVGAIQPNRRQPRSEFDEDELAELSHSIAEIGVLQPVVLRELLGADLDEAQYGPEPAPARYELVMGERRWRATILAGLDTIPAIIRDTQDDALLRDALLENLHRSQLNPLEEAAAYQQLLEDFGGTHDELAARLGRSRPQISNTIRLLNLPPLVARRVAAGVLSAGHARALLALSDGAAMERLAQRIVAESLSVRSVEEIVTLAQDSGHGEVRSRRQPQARPELDQLAAELSDRFDTRVRIAMGQRRGRLSVEFASIEDLQRILALLSESQSPGRHTSGEGISEAPVASHH